MKKKSAIFNSIRAKNKAVRVIKISDSITVRFKADAGTDDPAEVMLYDQIGKDYWSGQGITASDFKNALKEVKGRSLMIRVNSLGGDVFEGMAIKALLDEWPQTVTCKIDGIAASTASFIPMGCDKIIMAKGSQMFVHDAWGVCQGNAADMEKVASQLDSTSDLIASMYADRNGKTVAKMRGMMQDESLMTATECKELGLCDEISTDAAVRNFTDEEISGMKAKLQTLHAVTNSASDKTQAGQTNKQKPQDNVTLVMNKTRMLALLKKRGITPKDNATDEELAALIEALPAETANGAGTVLAPANAAEVETLRKQVDGLTKINDIARRQSITARVEKLIGDDKLAAGTKDSVIDAAMKDETVLEIFDKQPSKAPGTQNLDAPTVELTGEGFKDVQNFILENGPRFSARMCPLNALNPNRTAPVGSIIQVSGKVLHEKAVLVANAIAKHRNMLVQMFNTNTIDAELQRTVILSDLVRAYAVRLLPLTAFAKTFQSVPLEGTDKVAVPYFALQTVASTDWVAATGYVAQDTAQSVRDVTVNKRKYQAMAFTSQELRRQPYQNWQQLAIMNAQKLGVDVNADVLSIITAANYGASVKAVPGAAFSGDDISDLYGSATDLNWPDEGRSLVLTTAYKVGLLKDPTFKGYLSAGTTDALRKAQIQEAYGFEDIYTVPTANLPTNAQNLTGFMCHRAAALVATAPIMPGPAVRALMVQYDLVIDPVNNIALEYKLMGDSQKDKTIEVVEANYGYGLGVAAALARITSQ